MRLSLIRRDPSYFFENMHEDLNRFLRDSFREFGSGEAMEKAWRPALEIKETKDQYKIKAELPGINKEDMDIELNENYIVIKGETEKCEKKEEENMQMSEFRYGKFYRSIPLEKTINTTESSAEFKNGVLYIDLKKEEIKEPEVKKLEIK